MSLRQRLRYSGEGRNPVFIKNIGLRLLSATGGFAGVTGFKAFYEVVSIELSINSSKTHAIYGGIKDPFENNDGRSYYSNEKSSGDLHLVNNLGVHKFQ